MAQNNDVHIEGSVLSPNTNGGISGNELQYDSLCIEQNPLSEVPNESQILWTDIVKKGTTQNHVAVNVETDQTIGNTLPRKNRIHCICYMVQQGKHPKVQPFQLILTCILLTNSEDARSLSYKVTINSGDYERATKDASIWPYRVGMRLFKHFGNAKKTNQNMAHNKARKAYNTRDRYGKQRNETQRVQMGNHTVLSRGNAGNFVNPTVLSRENKGNFVNGFNMGHYVNDERSVWLRSVSHN